MINRLIALCFYIAIYPLLILVKILESKKVIS